MIEVTFMSMNNEIEFKQILDQDTYSKIYELYFKNQSPFKQTNFYIDTENFKLKQHQAALRIRVKDYMYEMTLKVPAEVGLTEYNHSVNIEPKLDMSLQLSQLPKDIRNILEHDFNILENELKVLGNLTTYRLERAAEAAYLLDEEMSEIKDEIQEAQKYYTQKRAKKHEND